jgi:hypothetical protein
MEPKPEDLAEFFRTRKIGFDRCLEPTMQCGEPAIRAHSIQNRQTIALLEWEHVARRRADPRWRDRGQPLPPAIVASRAV